MLVEGDTLPSLGVLMAALQGRVGDLAKAWWLTADAGSYQFGW